MLVMTKLASCIKDLQARIKEHRDSLSKNELRTRISLIDPLLCTLGWDVSDPRMVTLEYPIGVIKADYALLGESNKPVAILETKKLGSDLSNHRMQMLNYANMQGIPYAGLSNGDAWELYDVFERSPLPDKKILDLSIEKSPAYHTALRFLCLWRPNLGSGKVTHAKVPITGLPDPPPPPQPPPTPPWINLADYKPEGKTSAPSEVRFWNGAEKKIKFWTDMVRVTVEILYKTNLLTESRLPYAPSNKNFVIHTRPQHDDGTRFLKPTPVPGTPLHMNLNLSAEDIRLRCRKLLVDFGKDPKTDMYLKVT